MYHPNDRIDFIGLGGIVSHASSDVFGDNELGSPGKQGEANQSGSEALQQLFLPKQHRWNHKDLRKGEMSRWIREMRRTKVDLNLKELNFTEQWELAFPDQPSWNQVSRWIKAIL
jgi:hypothetical protein